MLRRLLRDDLPAHLSLANLVGFGLTFLAIPIIAREIGPIGRGETSAALSAFAIASTLLGMGIPLELRRRSAGQRDESSVRTARDLIALSVVLAIGLGALFVFTIYSSVDDQLRLAALVGIVLTPISVSWAADAGSLAGEGRYRAVALIRVAHPAVTLIVIGVSSAMGTLTAPMVILASVVSTIATGSLGFFLCRVSVFGQRAGHVRLARSGARFAGSAVAESASSRLDQIIVLPLIGATAAGQYSIAASVALLPLALGQALAADHFRASAASVSVAESRAVERKAIREAISVATPACVIFAVIAAPLMPVVFGADFGESIPVLLALIPGSICLTVGYVATMLLAAQGRGRVMTALHFGGLTVGIVLLLILGPLWSAVGAGIASSISYVALLIGQLIALRLGIRDIVPTFGAFRSGLRSLWPRREL